MMKDINNTGVETNQISVNNASRVEVEETTQDLIDKVLNVLVSKSLARADDLRKIGIHQISHDINIIESIVILRPDDIDELQNLNSNVHK